MSNDAQGPGEPIEINSCGDVLSHVFEFLDPNDNSQLVLILTVRGFIVPGEAGNFAFFDEKVLYALDIENTGDARPDETIEVRAGAG